MPTPGGLTAEDMLTLLHAMAVFHISHKLEPSQPDRPAAYYGDGVTIAEQLLRDMLQGKLGEAGRPNTASFNAIIEVLPAGPSSAFLP